MDVKKFNRGEMYWYVNPDVKKENYLKDGENQDFLDNRPVLIVSDYIDEYHSSVIVVPTTTSAHRNGIDIETRNERFEVTVTKLMPMRIRNVPTKYLKTFMGRVNDDILNKVYDALDFHCGRTKNIPDYVIRDREIHKEINERETNKTIVPKNSNKKEIQIATQTKDDSKVKSKKEFPYGELERIRQSFISMNVSSSSCQNVRQTLYSIKSTSKLMKRKYDSIHSYKDKYGCLTMHDKEIARKYNVNIQQAILLKNLCSTEIAIEQMLLLDKIARHDIQISSLSNRDKITFLSISNSEFDKYIKKGDVVINNYKSQFSKELNL